MAQAMVNIRMDADLKKDVEQVCAEMGLSMTAAFTLFAKKLSREHRIPFDVVGEMPQESAYQVFMSGIDGFTEDCFSDAREQEFPVERESL